MLYAPTPSDGEQAQIVERLVVRGGLFFLFPEIGPVPNRSRVMEFPPEDTALMDIKNPLDRSIAKLAKRVIGILGFVVGLFVLFQLLILIVIAVKTDGGPAIFCQKRVGKDGLSFECMKFRSMVVDAEARLQSMIASDPEIRAEWVGGRLHDSQRSSHH